MAHAVALFKSEIHRDIIKAAQKAPYLEREDEKQLALRWKNAHDQKALDCLMRAHMRLVIAMAGKFRNYGLPISDLIQEGNIGLLEAAARFEPERDIRFSTYASWWVRASMQDYILRNWSIVRGGTSSAQKALFFGLRRLRAKLQAKLRHEGQDARARDTLFHEIARITGVSKEDVETMDLRMTTNDLSLHASIAPDDAGSGMDFEDMLVDDTPLPDELAGDTIDAGRRAQWLNAALACLNAREIKVIAKRRLSQDVVTLEEIGHELGISKERVRQIESRAFEKLRRALIKAHPEAAFHN